ncbi:MAG: toll/interleukin-1 receptor domain-containing protein [Acidobacteriota bacterium]
MSGFEPKSGSRDDGPPGRDLSHVGVVFVSYCHNDRRWLDKLSSHLHSIQEPHEIVAWDDTRIEPGDKWERSISAAIGRADVAILLVSADYLASEFIRTHELPLLADAASARNLPVMPVLVSPSRFADIPQLAQFQAVNDPQRTLSSLPDWEREAIFVRLTNAIVQRIRGQTTTDVHAGQSMDWVSPTLEARRTKVPQLDRSPVERLRTEPAAPPVWAEPIARPLKLAQDPVLPRHLLPPALVMPADPMALSALVKDLSSDGPATLNLPSDTGSLSRVPRLDDYLPTPRQLPAAGGFFAAVERCWDWMLSQFATWDNDTRSVVAVILLLVSALLPPAVVVYARRQRHSWQNPISRWWVVYFLAIGVVATAYGGITVVEFNRAAPAATSAASMMERLRSERPMAIQELEAIWSRLPQDDKQDSGAATTALGARLARGRRDELGDRVSSFATARIAQEQHRTLTLVLAIAAILIGIQNVVCSAILGVMHLPASAGARK